MTRALAIALALALCLVSVTAFAYDRPCAEDVAKFCPTAKGGGARLECLKAHESEVSPACKARLAKGKEQVSELRAKCGDDAKKICPGMEGGAKLMKCLHVNEEKLSPACKEIMHAKYPPKK